MTNHLETGLSELRAGRDAAARQALAQIPAADPAYARAQNLLAQISLRGGELETAGEHARAAVAAAPEEPGCYLTLGRVCEALEDFQAGRDAGRKAIELDESSFNAWFLYGTQLLKLGSYGEAADAYRRAHELEPDRIEALVNLGSALDRAGAVAEALAAYELALQLAPGEPRILSNIGRLQAERGDFDDAITAYEQALTADPQFDDAWTNLAVACLQKNDPRRAIDAVSRCLQVFPAHRAATALAMMAYQQLGDIDNYRRLYAFEQLIYEAELDPPDGYASIAEFNAALARTVLAHPTLIHEPAGKSTRYGQQTGNLLKGDDSGIFELLHHAVRRHMEQFLARPLDAPGHPYAQYAPDDCDFYMWATVLDEQGHQDPHIHPAGWVSGVYYVQIPETITADDAAGWIEFGRPDRDFPGIGDDNSDLTLLPPAEGKLYLFPSYFYHRTIPYHGDRPRISIAFDLVPKRLRRRRESQPGADSQLQQDVAKLLRVGRVDQAQQACSEALQRDPRDPVALAVMGQVLLQTGRADRAAELFQQSLAVDPAGLPARLGLIGMVRQARRHDQALALADAGLEQQQAAPLYLARAELYIDVGRFDEACADLRAVLQRDAANARAAWLSVLLRDEQVTPESLGPLLTQSAPGQKTGLQFALARLHERAGNTQAAIEHYGHANAAEHQRHAAANQPADLAALKQHFNHELYSGAATGDSSEQPVFIVGMPRSGTTLVEQLLASHPQVATAGDTPVLWQAVGQLAAALPAGSRLPADIGRLPPEAAKEAADFYLATMKNLAGNAPRIVDRHLQNDVMLGIVQLLLPGARIIRCRRDPGDTRWSCYRTWFDNVLPYAYDLPAIAAAQEQERQLQEHWESVLSLQLLTVDYEQLATEPERMARRLIEFCGLQWDPAVLQFHAGSEPVISGDRIGVRRPVYADAVGRSKPFAALVGLRS